MRCLFYSSFEGRYYEFKGALYELKCVDIDVLNCVTEPIISSDLYYEIYGGNLKMRFMIILYNII